MSADLALLEDVRRGIAGRIHGRFGGYRHADREDAVAIGVLHVFDYWCGKYELTPQTVPLAVHFGSKRASEALCGELTRQEHERLYADYSDDDKSEASWFERKDYAVRVRRGEL